MSCEYNCRITDVLGSETDGNGRATVITVKGSAVTDTQNCLNQIGKIEVYLLKDDGRRTPSETTELAVNSHGDSTDDWEVTLSSLYDINSGTDDKTSMFMCKENLTINIKYKTEDGTLLCDELHEWDNLVCCPSAVTLNVHHNDILLTIDDNGRYSQLEPGNYTISVIQPDDNELLTYEWFIEDETQNGETSRIFIYSLQEGESVDIRCEVTSAGCAGISETAKLRGFEAPTATEAPTDTPTATLYDDSPTDTVPDNSPTETSSGSLCWLALLFLAIGLVVVFVFLIYSPCIVYSLIGSLVGLIVMVVAVIFAAILCDRCRIFRTLAWAIWWAMFLGGFSSMIGCPLGTVPVISILLVIQAFVIATINRIKGCVVPHPFELPFNIKK